MKSSKQIQIPEELFNLMAAYVLEERFQTEDIRKKIISGIYAKIDRMEEHELYTKYKTAPTDSQREEARQEYLDRKGIHPDYRW